MSDIQKRLDFIDLLRGLVICLMVLDHTRDFIHIGAMTSDPLNLSTGGPALYITRWITHLCAPTFVFLSGVSIFLQAQKGKTGWPLSRFLLTRGLWLVFLELTLVNLGFDLWPGIFLQVIWAIGMSMVIMAALVWLPRLAVLGVGIAIVAGHNLLAPIDAPQLTGAAQVFWMLFMEPAFTLPLGGFNVYPVIPWLGIMCLGYGLTSVITDSGPNRARNIALLAIGCIVAFLCLRLPNLYGNSVPWAMPADPAEAPFAVLNVLKYPPSLHYVLITLGVALLIMLALPKLPALAQKPLLAFGRTPLLTYLLHIYVAHGLAVLVGVIQGIPAEAFLRHLSDPSRTTQAGLPLWGVYIAWIAVLAILYPISSAWAKYRATHKHWWTSYL
ncbi:membrane protein-like protein [Asticcacaulis biprosthecium C19]|uniref:Membrane protein-like protein n=1 Tax=Asticcacaulis biprosthecium C19 TaxID=715226 RepID=F4QJI6_9CAUL|nr:heparan-alpha-glucosaminide N-acetyltransferase domain-containing protein [Asticcacaulis biprosthecium]EGF91937.1 membrane protein-like protein [Asticcacaulis biprosthecium C19]